MLGWLANHWLIVAAVVVGIAAAAAPALVWKLKAWILLAVVLWWGWTGHAAYDRLVLQTRTDAALAAAQIATARAQSSEAARVEEQVRGRAIDSVAKAYERGKRDAQAAGDAVAAGLRTGAVRFRQLWQECSTGSAQGGVPGAAAGTGEPAGTSAGRADSAGRIVRATSQDAAQIRCLQALALTDRGIDPGDLSKGCPEAKP